MKRFLLKMLCFLSPFVALLAMELFVLPLDAFSFRVWESLYILQVLGLPPGRFYPEMTVTKVEQGDLAPYTSYAVKKSVVWHTDRYGFRQEDRGETMWPIVMVGDSSVAGTGLTQSDMVGQSLAKRMGRSVYSYAPFDINKFVADVRFHDNPPATLVLAVVERGVLSLPPLRPPGLNDFIPEPRWKTWLKERPWFKRMLIVVDRYCKENMLNYLRSRIKAKLRRWAGENPLTRPRIGRIVFYEGKTANRAVSNQNVAQTVSVLCGYRDYLSACGIRFVFVGVPNKENFYFDLFPGGAKPTCLPILLQGLREAGVETVDLQTPFAAARLRGEILYHADDTHWNARGADLAAQTIADVLTNPPSDRLQTAAPQTRSPDAEPTSHVIAVDRERPELAR